MDRRGSGSSSGARRKSDVDQKPVSVQENVARLRECEDYNLALQLQEEEFSQHYDKNRVERKLIGGDYKKSKEEQLAEATLAAGKRLQEAEEIARRDEELAREIQRQLEEEDRRNQLSLAQMDEELARRLHLEEHDKNVFSSARGSQAGESQSGPSTSNGPSFGVEKDEDYAKKLQERYYQKFSRKPHRHLDENTQNEVNILMDSNIIQTPSPVLSTPISSTNNLVTTFPPLPTYEDCMLQHSLQDQRRNSEHVQSNVPSYDSERLSNVNRRNSVQNWFTSAASRTSNPTISRNGRASTLSAVTTFSVRDDSLPRENASDSPNIPERPKAFMTPAQMSQMPKLPFLGSIANHPLAKKNQENSLENRSRDEEGDLISFSDVDSIAPVTNGTSLISVQCASPSCLSPNTSTGPKERSLVLELHSTNPFLQDLIGTQIEPQTEKSQASSEFGLPPPSDLLYGNGQSKVDSKNETNGEKQ
ncbi:hypothetical protein DdX_10102 [Ditylenchus destructor]|uniref:Coiled-coil domain-containing protein n=1 Tax=Ditylenchus destructor TaxID=166010 RepID=A0AAD4N0S4_9BILA|nr:hypothetical protein DdX_10102 [Ditylenchus destructor]